MAPNTFKIKMGGFKKFYYPGETITGNMEVVVNKNNKKDAGRSTVVVVKSNIYLERISEVVHYSADEQQEQANYSPRSVEATRDVIRAETSGETRGGSSGLAGGADAHLVGLNFPLEFQLPPDATNTSRSVASEGFVHSNAYFVCAKLALSHSSRYFSTQPRTVSQRHDVTVRCRAPAHPRPMTTGMSKCWGSGSGMDFFSSTHHLSVMVRCSTSSFKPGEEFVAQVAIIDKSKTGKRSILKVDLYYGQKVEVHGDRAAKHGKRGRKMKAADNSFRAIGDGSTANDESTLTSMLNSNAGRQYMLTVPPSFMEYGASYNGVRVLRRYIVFKPWFFTGTSRKIKFPVD